MAIMVSPGHPAPPNRDALEPITWKVQAQLSLSTTQQPWASSLASKSLSFLICKVGTVLSPPHQIVTGTKDACALSLAYSRHSNLGASVIY